MSARRAVFLDRDGTLNVEVPLVATPDDLTPIDGIGPAVRAINEAGFLAILLTNQAAVARGDCASPHSGAFTANCAPLSLMTARASTPSTSARTTPTTALPATAANPNPAWSSPPRPISISTSRIPG